MTLVDVAAPGFAFGAQWAPVAGATRAEVTQATLAIRAAATSIGLGELDWSWLDQSMVVRVPQGRRIRSITLFGLTYTKIESGEPKDYYPRSDADLRDLHLRVVVRLSDPRGWSAPVFTVPPLPAQKMVPAMLTGAAFAYGVLTLPDVTAPALLISLAERDAPNTFEEKHFTVTKVTGRATLLPRDLGLTDADGNSVWAFPGDMPPDLAPVGLDLRRASERALNAAIAAGRPPSGRFRLAAREGKVDVEVSSVTGALLRAFPGTLRTEVDADREGAPLPVGALPGEPPTEATADLVLRYRGLRLLADLSDPLPPPAVPGLVVGAQEVVRPLPPRAFERFPLGRVALLGRAPEPCELAVAVVDHAAGAPGRTLASATASIPASRSFGAHAIDLPASTAGAVQGPVAIQVRASRGRFYWATAASGLPAVRIAVRDADPGGRPVRLGGATIASLGSDELRVGAGDLTAAFAAGVPLFSSDLFVTVDVASLTLRYARSS